MSDRDLFVCTCAENKFIISQKQLELLDLYVDALLDWNQKINLVSRKDNSDFWTRHLLASISFLFDFSFEVPASVLDLGTGGGLPGIPLSILVPGLRVTLLDSIQKKMNAVSDIVRRMGLSEIDIVCSRAEDLAKAKTRTSFDYIISRAVAPVAEIIEWSTPMLNREQNGSETKNGTRTVLPKGSTIMLKGGDLSNEISAALEYYPDMNIETHPIRITGSQRDTLSDKKIVIAQP